MTKADRLVVRRGKARNRGCSGTWRAPVLRLDMKPHPDHMSTTEAAALLGVSASKVRAMVRSGELPGIAISGTVRIPRAAVEPQTGPEVVGTAEANDVRLVEQILGCPLASLPLLLDAEWLAKKLDCTAKAARAAMRDGTLPSVMVGARRRVPTPAFVRWLLASGEAA